MNNIEIKYYQILNIQYLKNTYGKELWVQVSGHRDLNGAFAGFWAGLVYLDDLEKVTQKSDWETHIGTQAPGFVEYGNGDIKYEKISTWDIYCEHVVNYRDFHGIKPEYVEVVEELRLLNNLYHDFQSNILYAIKDNGVCEEVVKIENNTDVFIKLNYLINYATAKQMALLLFLILTRKSLEH